MPDINPHDDEFIKAFGEDAPSTEMSEDDAFGLTPPAAEQPAGDAPHDGIDAVVVVADGEGDDKTESGATDAKEVNDQANAEAGAAGGGETTGSQEAAAAAGEGAGADGTAEHEGMETAATEAAEQGSGMDLDDLSDVPAEDMQRAKSWQGRLKKIEAELRAKLAEAGKPATPASTADAAADAIETAAERAPAGQAEAMQEVASQIEAGEIDVDEGMRQLAEDFGEPFVRIIEAVAKRAASSAVEERVGKVAKDVEDVIAHITDSSQREHFEAIHDAHPDFMEVSQDPAFQAFVEEQGAQDVVESGTARQINRLLSKFKQGRGAPAPAGDSTATPATDAVRAAGIDPAALSAAEGVRSGGLRLPDEPKKRADDFESAWAEF